ncbi:MAG: hypothetical protein ACP5IC_00900 [Minisyncoccia bacterium]
MKEYITEGIVIDYVNLFSSLDRIYFIYTKDFGLIKAKAISARKIISKLSPQLDYLNYVLLRIIDKNQYIIADVYLLNKFDKIKQDPATLKKILSLLKTLKLVAVMEKDIRLWYWLKNALNKNRIVIKEFLKISGFDLSNAKCEICNSKNIFAFYIKDQSFLCKNCSNKFKKSDLLLIY